MTSPIAGWTVQTDIEHERNRNMDYGHSGSHTDNFRHVIDRPEVGMNLSSGTLVQHELLREVVVDGCVRA
jgi:hypothetical protein